MKRNFLFFHGFGFGFDFWNFLKIYFSPENCFFLDSGYFGKKIKLKNKDNIHKEYIGIGHSLGLIKLLNLKITFKALIGVNAFIHFNGYDLSLKKKRKKELILFEKSFKSSPLETLNNFYKRCGYLSKKSEVFKKEKLEKLNTFRILEDLNLLAKEAILQKEIPVLILASKNDLIVPLEIIKDNFEGKNNVQIKILEKGGHLLGLKHTKEIYSIITNFLNEIS